MTRACLVDPFSREVREVATRTRPGAHNEQDEIDALLDCDRLDAMRPFDAGANVIYLGESAVDYVREQIV